MHDVIEGTKTYLFIHLLKSFIGILEYEAKELLQQHIDKDGYYSLECLNQKITGFELGLMETKNQPSTIALSTLHSNDHKLKQEGNNGCNINFVFLTSLLRSCTNMFARKDSTIAGWGQSS